MQKRLLDTTRSSLSNLSDSDRAKDWLIGIGCRGICSNRPAGIIDDDETRKTLNHLIKRDEFIDSLVECYIDEIAKSIEDQPIG